MYVASGKFNLAIFLGTKQKHCEVSADKIILEEAGGIVNDFFGKSQRYNRDINGADISNGKIYQEVLDTLIKNN